MNCHSYNIIISKIGYRNIDITSQFQYHALANNVLIFWNASVKLIRHIYVVLLRLLLLLFAPNQQLIQIPLYEI